MLESPPSGELPILPASLPGSWIAVWPEIQCCLSQRSKILVALDYDSVAEFSAPGGNEAGPSMDLDHLLRKLQASRRVALALLSSRSVRDLRSRAILENAIYAGNHGAEIEGWGLSRTDGLASSCRSDLVDVFSCLSRYARQLPGIIVEDHGLSLSADGKAARDLEKERTRALLGALIRRRPRLQVIERPGGWDVRVRASWDKGHAIRQMMDHLGIAPSSIVYLAGAETDAHTLSDLAAGHTFAIGGAHVSTAKYRLSTRMDVLHFLFCLLAFVSKSPLP